MIIHFEHRINRFSNDKLNHSESLILVKFNENHCLNIRLLILYMIIFKNKIILLKPYVGID